LLIKIHLSDSSWSDIISSSVPLLGNFHSPKESKVDLRMWAFARGEPESASLQASASLRTEER